ncbi:MAG: AMP-binding protein [Bacteroidales bacterium]
MEIKTLRDLFEISTTKYSNNKFLFSIEEDGYTYGKFGSKTIEIQNMLSLYGINPEDKVGIFSQNNINWAVAYFSIVAFGRVSVPILPDFSESDIRYILKHSESKALFVSKRLLHKVSEKAKERLSLIVLIDDFTVIKGEKVREKAIENHWSDINTEDLCVLIYTSGTTGSSKGVMLSHKNLCANLHNCQVMRPSYSDDVWLSILPLSHTFENGLGLLLPMSAGAIIYYISKPPTPSVLMSAMKKVRPTTMLTVPLIIEKIYKKGIRPQFQKNLFIKFIYKIPPFRKVLNFLAGKKLKRSFGGRLRFFGIGGAKLDTEVERFLYEAKFPYAIGYGLTETSPLLFGAVADKVKIGSTGIPVVGVITKLINKNARGVGEIVVKGDNIMMGYYKNEIATKESFTDDGWFRTKDLGYFDFKNRLSIKGRISNTIIGPSGENIYPEEIEGVINAHYLVNESMVHEENGKLTAIINFNKEKLDIFLNQKEKLKRTVYENMEALKKEIMDSVNSQVSKFSNISKVYQLDKDFEKTATYKIKRYLYSLGNKSKTKEV